MSQVPHKQRGSHTCSRSIQATVRARYLPGVAGLPLPPKARPMMAKAVDIGQAAVPAQPLPDVTPPRPLRDIVPAQAMAHGGTIIRPGAVAWGGAAGHPGRCYSSCEAIERILAARHRRPRSAARPARRARRHPAVGAAAGPAPPVHRRHRGPAPARRLPETETDFVPCFTTVQRLTAWADDVEPDPRGGGPLEEFRFGGSGRQWQRAGDARVVPHVVVPAAGLARRLPAGARPGAQPRRRARPPALPGVRQLPGQARPAGLGHDRPRPPPDRAARPAQRGPGPAARGCASSAPPPAPGCRSPTGARAW